MTVRVKVEWEQLCQNVRSFVATKEFDWPCLLPIGTDLVLQFAEGKCELPNIKLYYWGEGNNLIYCELSPGHLNMDKTEALEWFRENGWEHHS